MLKLHLQPLACLLLLLLTGCGAARLQTAENIAKPAGLAPRQIAAGPFSLTAYERIGEQNAPATIYIEGDGLSWLDKWTPSLDPTPTDPVALRLAAADSGENVVYLARPCQYTKMTQPIPCPDDYWTGKRFAPEVIDAIDTALTDIKNRYHLSGFDLTGFSGGAAVAALLTARRDDVLSLRTVAGNLDTAAFSRIHGLSPMTGSLNPADAAKSISDVPQHHFIGQEDNIVPRIIADGFIAAAGDRHCIRTTIVPGVTHEKGWVEHWPDLLREPVDCNP